jgi:hypothetical protein
MSSRGGSTELINHFWVDGIVQWTFSDVTRLTTKSMSENVYC